MKTTHKTLSALTLLSLSVISLAQAPIVRQPPPPPDQQQTQPNPPPPPPPADAQQQQEAPPPPVAPQQLDQLVQRIALYPDPLLAQVLTASTFWDQIPDAAT